MNNQIQLVLKSSTTELSLNDRELGIYLVPELEGLTGLPEIRTTSGVNAGYDGGWTSAQNYDARSITIRGVIANEDVATVEQLRRQLTTLAGQGKNEELTLDLVTQAGKAYTIQVRTIALEMSLQKVLTQQEFMIQLRADDPLIYDNTEAGEPAIVQVQKALGGFQIPFEIPLAIGGGEDASVIDNHGLEQVAPIVKMYGALHNPKIINQTTNQYMQIEANLGYAEGAYTDAETSDSGQHISFNAPITAPLADFSLKGNTAQQTYTGKNLYSAQKTQTTAGGITYSIENGVMKINGTRTEASNLGVTSPITYKANTTYTCSVRVVSGSLSFDSKWGSQITFGNVGGSKYVTIYDAYAAASKMATISFTPTEDTTTNLTFWFGYESNWTNKTFNNIVVELQVEANSSPTSFEPYTNGPAPNPDYPQPVKTVTGENVVKVCGKNLVFYPYYNSTKTTNGITFTDNGDGTISANGTASAQALFWISRDIWSYSTSNIVIPAGTYTISKTGRSDCTIYATVYGRTQGPLGTFSASENDASFTVTEESSLTVRLSVASGATLSGFIFRPQIELGSTATAYEPYQGQSYEVNLGKNLFDASQDTTDYFINSSGAEVANTSWDISGYIPVVAGQTYSYQGLTNVGNAPYSAFYDASKTFVSSFKQAVGSNTITIPSGVAYVRFTIYHNDLDGVNDNQTLQIEKGSQATSYAAYFEPIELCKIGTYQDYIYKDGGKWYVHKEVGKHLFDGSENWWESGAQTDNVYQVATGGYAGVPVSAGYSDRLEIITTTAWYAERLPNKAVFTSNNIYVRVSLSLASTLEQFKAWLASNPITLYYALATPTDTTITNEALIEQLDAILNSGRVYEGTNNITTVIAAGNAKGEVQVSYYTHQDPSTRDEIIIDSRLRTITLNGLDIYDKKTEGSDFLMLVPGENKLILQSDIEGDNGYAEVNYKQGYLSI